MRARAWTEPVADDDDLKPRETPHVAARMVRTEMPRIVNEEVSVNFICMELRIETLCGVFLPISSVHTLMSMYGLWVTMGDYG